MTIASFLTPAKLRQIDRAAEPYWQAIVDGCDHYGINTPLTVAHFLAQVGHESGGFRFLREIWGPTPAQRRYDGRADLGNTLPEARAYAREKGMAVGKFYAGHGAIQITGYDNHLAYSRDIYDDDRCAAEPELLARNPDAMKSACWFFAKHSSALKWARSDAVERVTKAINGGRNGLADRIVRLDKAKRVIGVP